MKRSLFFLSSAIGLGALAGYLISDAMKLVPEAPAAVRTAFSTTASAHRSKVAAAGPKDGSVFVHAIEHVTALLPGAKPQPKAVGLLLKEPVVIVQGGSANANLSLPEGTPVALVKNEGRFLRVRHDQSVVTIPRSAVVMGVVRTN